MFNVVGVSFENKSRIYYFSPNHYDLRKGDMVIVETERGLQFGTVESEIINFPEEKLHGPLKYVIRIADKEDIKDHEENIAAAKAAIDVCRELVDKYKLDMQIIKAEYTFDREQLMFHFLSDNRVDFRALAKELAAIYHTRIELRQIGVRDKAKEVGGVGPCGRCLCCSQFLNDFETVSINMAKNQNISLNPSKINGLCGRLLCCLKYEDECYKDCRKLLPNLGSRYKTEKGEGVVVHIDILRKKFKVDVPEIGIIEVIKD